jgi:TPR repeat protein
MANATIRRAGLAGSLIVLALAVGVPSVAQAVTGQAYYDGMEAYKRRDYATAYRKLLPYAERGIALVQHQIGVMHAKGLGVPADMGQAVAWYRKAAFQGFGGAQATLGDMYLRGAGVAKIPAAAAWWLERAANQGYGSAQYNMAYMYINADGKPKDFVRAYAWLTRAVGRNYRPAAALRDQLQRAMSSAQVSQAVRLARGQVAWHFGAGVVVNNAGYILTAYHLVDGCRTLLILGDKQRRTASVKGYDIEYNLAVLKLSQPTAAAVAVPWEKAVRGGFDVYQAGLRMNGTAAPDVIVAKRRIDGLSGPNNDRRFVRLAAATSHDVAGVPRLDASGRLGPINTGQDDVLAMPGAPLLDGSGRLVAINVGRDHVLAVTGAPQDSVKPRHQYVIAAATVSSFLKYYDVEHARARAGGPAFDQADLAARARAVTVGFACRR